jgi:hypothetical protein
MGPEERRGSTRVKLEKLAYINLPSGNGGIVLDVSSEGLGFQAAASLEAAGPTRFRLLVGSVDQIEAAAELRWIDETGKRAGLRFTDLPDEVRDQVRIWLGQPRLTPTRSNDAPPTPGAGAEFVPARKRGLVPVEQREASHSSDGSGVPSVAMNVNASGNRRATSRLSPEPPSEPMGLLPALPVRRTMATASPDSRLATFPPEHFPAAPTALVLEKSNAPSAHNLASLVFFLMLGVAIGISSLVYKGLAGKSLIRLGQRLSGESRRNPAVRGPAGISSPGSDTAPVAKEPADPEIRPAPAPAAPNDRPRIADRSSASIDRPPADPSQPQSEAGAGSEPSRESTPGFSARVDADDRDHEVPRTGENGDAELAFAHRYLGEGGDREGTARAAQLLWLAVEKGSTAAEVELAGLYVRGEGVPKNCEQARVLLTAAHNEDSRRAEQELAELQRYGCR